MRLLTLCMLQVFLLVWMHHLAVSRNLWRLRSYVSRNDARRDQVDGGMWVHLATGGGFRLCADCLTALYAP